MDKTELRIGNLVYPIHLDGEAVVMGIGIDGLRLHQRGDDSKTSFVANDVKHRLEPIPLTEKWLLSLGFNSIDFVHDGLEDNGYYEPEMEFSLNRSFQFSEYHKRIDLQYVHQLQNLYFALTGKELIIK